MAFEPRHSDLPLQVAFPVLLANLSGELMGGSDAPLDAVAPGAPVTLPVPEGALGVRVERPDGTRRRARRADQGRRERDVRADRPARRLHGLRRSPIPTRPPRRPGGASPGVVAAGRVGRRRRRRRLDRRSPTFRPPEAGAPTRFAVDLLDVDESVIAPGDPAKLTALGTRPRPGRGPARVRRRAPERARRAVDPDRAARPRPAHARVARLRARHARAGAARSPARLGRPRPTGRSA